MNNYLKEALIIQNQLGVDASFDFITGREFNINKTKATTTTIQQTKEKKQPEQIEIKQEQKIETKEEIKVEKLPQINLDNIATFEDLCDEIKNFNGCDLKRHCHNSVIFDGNTNAKIMLIGEAPGETEDLEGKPFCGKSGQLLRKALSFIGLTTDNLLISNVVFWRPPMNRVPNQDEIEICFPFVKKMIEIIKPKIVILCGSTSTNTIFGEKKPITKIAGISKEINENFDCKFMAFPIYHPSYLLRNPSAKKEFWKNLLSLKQII